MLATIRRALPYFSVAILGVALWILHRQLSGERLDEVRRYLAGLGAERPLLALAFTAVGYLALTGYDWLGFRHFGQAMPYRRVALASSVGYAFANGLGHALLTGLPIRLRMYSAWQVGADLIARVVAFNFLTFWLGFLTLAGCAFVATPLALPASVPVPLGSLRLLGAVILTAVIAYLLTGAVRRAPVRVRGLEFTLPRPATAAAQIGLAILDLGATAMVLRVLLPAHEALPLPVFLTLFLVAHLAGALSALPGGIGVFETVFVVLMPAAVDPAQVVGALLAYRLVYYLLPLLLATLALAAQEVWRRRHALEPAARLTARWSGAVVPQALALATFVAGAVLLLSGATPASTERLRWLARALPLPVVESSHFAASLIGVGLLILARGLQRRIHTAYLLTLALLVAGAITALFRGLDVEEAVYLVVMLAALIAARGRFDRRASLLGVRLTPGWVAAILAVIAATAWLVLFAYRQVDYADELWWRFAWSGAAPRALRALVGTVTVTAALLAVRALRPSPPPEHPPSAEELERAAAIAAASPRVYGQLALLGDKNLLFDDSGSAFLMYAVEGRSWVALRGPVGPEERHRELLWRFRDRCERHGGWPVFYQIDEDQLHRYLDLGLSLFKLGEEGSVPLTGFSLEGSGRKELRQAVRKKEEREGLRFAIMPAAEVAGRIDELRAVSDAWLADKNTREKGFSLGFFDPAYVGRFPLAVVYEGERILAFANVLEAGGKEELSIDLMRYLPEPRGLMDYLFIRLMLWGAENGFTAFSMGMAPLAGFEERPGAPLWNRVGALIYRYGEYFYNFEGLRQYKDKFDPSWEPRFLASPGGLALPRILIDVATLIAGGVRGVFGR